MSGNAIPGCGAIHKTEINPTLTKLSDDFEFPFDLNNYTIGSTGKIEYSGDIDLVIDSKWYDGIAKDLANDAIKIIGESNIAMNGALLHIKYPIVNYDALKNKRQPRTGFVQIDFNFGDYDKLSIFYHSAGDNSKFKGLHRNIALSSIAGVVENIRSQQTTDSGEPVEQIRWKWSPKGLMRVRRFFNINSSGNFNKNSTDQELGIVISEVHSMAKKLLHGSPEDMDSLETIYDALINNFRKETSELIFERIAKNFVEKSVINGYEFPPEIAKYIVN